MGLRSDLVEQLTPEMLLEGILANQHRYKPEPLLATTGTGSLLSATPADRKVDHKLRKKLNRAVLKAAGAPKR